MGKLRELSWMAMEMRPLRWPKRVPVVRVAPWMWPSLWALMMLGRGMEPWKRQAGLMMGRERKTERKTRSTLGDLELRLRWEAGWRRVISASRVGEAPDGLFELPPGFGGGGGRGGGGGSCDFVMGKTGGGRV